MIDRARLGPAGATVLLAVSLCGVAGSAVDSGRTTRAGSPKVTVRLPAGWVSRSLAGGGFAAAGNKADLRAAVPAGPALTIQPVATRVPDLASLIAKADRAPFVGAISTSRISVAGKRAFYVQWTAAEKAGNETTRAVLVTLGHGSAYSFTMRASASRWPAAMAALRQILATVGFR